jgi:hypothetical protein
MTDTVLCQIIQKQIDKAFSQNRDVISSALADELGNETTPVGEVIGKVATNTVRLSILMSVQMTLRILENAGVIDLDGDYGPMLEVIPGGKR